MSENFQEGDPVLIVYDDRRRWIRTVSQDQFHCNHGSINLNGLIGKSSGTSIQTSKGVWLYAHRPTIIDWINNFSHKSQIIYEKDAAMISMLLDIKPGDTIYEAGTGSGALTAVLAQSVGNQGKIVTHDNRPNALNVAKENLDQIPLKNVDYHLKDVKNNGFVRGKADGVVLDLGDPWEVIPHVPKVLKSGGIIVIFIPTFNQMDRTIQALNNYNFKDIRGLELLEREIQLKSEAIRPSTRMIGHTGFLMTGRYANIV